MGNNPDCSVHKVMASVVPFLHQELTIFLETWFLILDGTLKMIVLKSVKESALAATMKINLVARWNCKKTFSFHTLLVWTVQRAPPTIRVEGQGGSPCIHGDKQG